MPREPHCTPPCDGPWHAVAACNQRAAPTIPARAQRPPDARASVGPPEDVDPSRGQVGRGLRTAPSSPNPRTWRTSGGHGVPALPAAGRHTASHNNTAAACLPRVPRQATRDGSRSALSRTCAQRPPDACASVGPPEDVDPSRGRVGRGLRTAPSSHNRRTWRTSGGHGVPALPAAGRHTASRNNTAAACLPRVPRQATRAGSRSAFSPARPMTHRRPHDDRARRPLRAFAAKRQGTGALHTLAHPPTTPRAR